MKTLSYHMHGQVSFKEFYCATVYKNSNVFFGTNKNLKMVS